MVLANPDPVCANQGCGVVPPEPPCPCGNGWAVCSGWSSLGWRPGTSWSGLRRSPRGRSCEGCSRIGCFRLSSPSSSCTVGSVMFASMSRWSKGRREENGVPRWNPVLRISSRIADHSVSCGHSCRDRHVSRFGWCRADHQRDRALHRVRGYAGGGASHGAPPSVEWLRCARCGVTEHGPDSLIGYMVSTYQGGIEEDDSRITAQPDYDRALA